MDNEIEAKATELIQKDGRIIPAEFHIWESDPQNSEMIKLSLKFSGREITQSHRDYFSAMRLIRRELEMEGLQLNCYGASKNVYPSAMSVDMGAGEKAYKLTLGKHAKSADIVSIFDTGQDALPTSTEDQEAFFEMWTKSI